MCFRFTSMPELQHLTLSQRRMLLRKCVGASIVWRIVAKSIGLGVCLGILTGVVVQALLHPGGSARQIVFLASAAFFSFLTYWVCLVRNRRRMLIWLERYGRDNQLPMCLGCGYDLEGAVSPTCPECGARIVPL